MMAQFNSPAIPKKKRALDHCEGYLLVEVLATMTISAMVLVGLVSVMHLVIHASQRTAIVSEKIEDSSAIISALARELESISSIRWAGANGGFVFQGTDHGVVFAREVDLPDGTADHRVVLLQGKGHQLTLSEMPLLPGYQSLSYLPHDDNPTLLQNKYTVRFAYFSRFDNGQEVLVPTWTRVDQLPVAVRISLVDDNGHFKAGTRVEIRVDAELGCAAPDQAVCGFFRPVTTNPGEDIPSNTKPVDANDDLGWMRYAK